MLSKLIRQDARQDALGDFFADSHFAPLASFNAAVRTNSLNERPCAAAALVISACIAEGHRIATAVDVFGFIRLTPFEIHDVDPWPDSRTAEDTAKLADYCTLDRCFRFEFPRNYAADHFAREVIVCRKTWDVSQCVFHQLPQYFQAIANATSIA